MNTTTNDGSGMIIRASGGICHPISPLYDMMHTWEDQRLHPWVYPDHPTWPTIVPLPKLARIEERWTAGRESVKGLRERTSDALNVLRHGLPKCDEW